MCIVPPRLLTHLAHQEYVHHRNILSDLRIQLAHAACRQIGKRSIQGIQHQHASCNSDEACSEYTGQEINRLILTRKPSTGVGLSQAHGPCTSMCALICNSQETTPYDPMVLFWQTNRFTVLLHWLLTCSKQTRSNAQHSIGITGDC
jgi:hypothetical protein